MKINLSTTKYYFLTCDTNGTRKQHVADIFKNYYITEVNPILGIDRFKSGASGFLNMIDLALRNQDRTLPFQPFIMFEDDVSKYREFPDNIDIPNDADICYVGLSKCGTHKDTEFCNKLYMKEINNDIVRVYNMLSLHGIMICSVLGATAIQKAMMEAYIKNIAWDLPIAYIQPYYNVYALKVPLVYQDARFGGCENETKFELSTIIDEDLPEYHRINCATSILCQMIKE